MLIKFYLLIFSIWVSNLIAANQRDFRIYQNMTCDAPVGFASVDHVAYWSKPDANRKLYYKNILQAVLMGRPKSSARYDDLLTKSSSILIVYSEKHLQADLRPALKVLKGAALTDGMQASKINHAFLELVKFASSLADPV